MATIKNDRDILLQGGTRILSTGISILATNTSFSTSGTTTTPSSITLTVSLPVARPSAVKTWTYARPSAPDTWIPFGSGDSITISSEAFKSAVDTGAYVEYKCYVTEPLYEDISAKYKISYSSAGQNAVRLDLTNEAHVVATDNAGSNGVYTGAVTTATVYNGSTDDSANWTFLAAKTNVTCSEATSSRMQTVTDLTADAGYIDITASRVGYSSITSRFNLTKSKGGVAYQIVPSVNAITKANTGIYTPTTITFSALSRMYTGASTSYTTGRFKVYTSTNGSTFTLQYTSAANEASYAYTIPAGISHVKGELYLAGGVTSLLDSESIPVVSDGKGYTLSILNGIRAIVYDKDGLNPSPTQTAFSASLFENGTAITPTTYAWSATGVLSGTSSASTFTPVASTTYAATPASVTLTTTYTGGVSVAQTVPVSISKTGNDGTPGTPGTPGTKSITISAFKWSNAGVGTYTQAFTYTWSGGSVSAYPSGWAASASASPGTGYTLYQINLIITASGASTSTATDWSSATVNTIGYRQDGSIGPQGVSARIAYQVTTSASPPGAPSGSGYGDSAPASWSFTATSTLSEGYYMYQTDGLYNAQTNTITWNAPYLSNLKVGSLSAISANLGTITMSTVGSLSSSGKSYGAGGGTGIFLGYSGGYKFDITGTSSFLRFDGASLEIKGSKIDTTDNGRFGGAGDSGWSGIGTVALIANDSQVAKLGIITTSTNSTGAGIYAIGYNGASAVLGLAGSASSVAGNFGNSYGGYGLDVGGKSLFRNPIISTHPVGTAPITVLSGSVTCTNLRAQYADSATTADSAGYADTAGVVINTTNGAALKISGSTYAVVQADSNFVFYLNGSAVWTYSGGFLSDKRQKTSIERNIKGLDVINSLNVVSYTWKTTSPMYDKVGATIQLGFYAQEVQQVLPEIVEEIGDNLLINKVDLIPYLLKAVQELSTELTQLKLEIKNGKL